MPLKKITKLPMNNKKPVRWCCVSYCPSTDDGTTHYHQFPPSGQKVVVEDHTGARFIWDRKKIWEDQLDVEEKIGKGFKVCSWHFRNEDYRGGRKGLWKKLKSTAIPTLYLPQENTRQFVKLFALAVNKNLLKKHNDQENSENQSQTLNKKAAFSFSTKKTEDRPSHYKKIRLECAYDKVDYDSDVEFVANLKKTEQVFEPSVLDLRNKDQHQNQQKQGDNRIVILSDIRLQSAVEKSDMYDLTCAKDPEVDWVDEIKECEENNEHVKTGDLLVPDSSHTENHDLICDDTEMFQEELTKNFKAKTFFMENRPSESQVSETEFVQIECGDEKSVIFEKAMFDTLLLHTSFEVATGTFTDF